MKYINKILGRKSATVDRNSLLLNLEEVGLKTADHPNNRNAEIEQGMRILENYPPEAKFNISTNKRGDLIVTPIKRRKES